MLDPQPSSFRAARPGVRFGISGWDYRDWRGPVYPTPTPRGFRPLRLLSQFLDFMEVNSTFYHPTGGSASRRWLNETPREFTFVLKAWQGWTHQREPVPGAPLELFRELMGPILAADRLEGILLQYPPSWRDSSATRDGVAELVAALAPARVFVEFRHRSLYRPEFYRFLQSLAVDFVNVDLPAVGSLPPPSTINTGPCGFVRLHGRNQAAWANPRATRDQRYDYRYSVEEIRSIIDSVRQLLARTPRLLIAANNHFAGHAPAAMVLGRALLEQRRVRAPARLIASHPELAPYCDPLDEDAANLPKDEP
ncbi:MAG: DUF72 domain-containing protein [Planctomycetota bacterium]